VIKKRPVIPVLFEVPALNCRKTIIFLVDTGSVYSAITEKEAQLAGIDCSMLPDYRKHCIGFGGTFRNKITNRPVYLTFGSNNNLHKITYGSGFQIVCIPSNKSSDEREKIIRYTPCVLGMDILCKFKLYLDKKKFFLQI
jgi:hypothetical protein